MQDAYSVRIGNREPPPAAPSLQEGSPKPATPRVPHSTQRWQTCNGTRNTEHNSTLTRSFCTMVVCTIARTAKSPFTRNKLISLLVFIVKVAYCNEGGVHGHDSLDVLVPRDLNVHQ